MDPVSLLIGVVVIAAALGFGVMMVRDQVRSQKECGPVDSCHARQQEEAKDRVHIR
jgi:hypothetical protein